MQIAREDLERDLASIRAQRDKAASVMYEAIGAEKVVLEMLKRLDQKEPEPEPAST